MAASLSTVAPGRLPQPVDRNATQEGELAVVSAVAATVYCTWNEK